jgi:hypothetical protein
MAVDDIIRVAGRPYSWRSTSSKWNNVPYSGFLEFNVEHAREGEYVHGQSDDGGPLGITDGIYSVTSLKFKMLADTADMIRDDIALAAGSLSFGDVGPLGGSTYELQIFEPFRATLTYTVSGIVIQKESFSTAKGTEALAVEWECKALQLITTGLSGLPQQLKAMPTSLF